MRRTALAVWPLSSALLTARDSLFPSDLGIDFRRLWIGQTVSLLGSQVTFIALPLTAILLLDATALQLGFLSSLAFLPSVAFGLLVGPAIDRTFRRPLLVQVNLLRAILLMSIPITAVFGALRIEQLYVVVLANGVLAAIFDIAYFAYIPSVLGKVGLVRANARLQFGNSLAWVLGPGLGGWLVAVLTAPLAIALDAISFIVSAAGLAWIRAAEPDPRAGRSHSGLVREIRDGLEAIFGNAYLRSTLLYSTTFNLFAQAVIAIYMLFAIRELGLGPTSIGAVFALAAFGTLVGSGLAGRATHSFGLGRAIFVATLLASASFLLLGFADGPSLTALSLLTTAFFLQGVGVVMSNVLITSLRQAVTPANLRGRVSATTRTISALGLPLGALVGGVIAESVGVRSGILIGSIGLALAPLWLLFSPLLHLATLPSGEAED